MVIAAPLAVAAPAALAANASTQAIDMHDSAKAVSTVRQAHAGTPITVQWYGAQHDKVGGYAGLPTLGGMPAFRLLENGRLAWDVQVAHGAQLPIAGIAYTVSGGADFGLALRHVLQVQQPQHVVPTHRGAIDPETLAWTWTQTAFLNS